MSDGTLRAQMLATYHPALQRLLRSAKRANPGGLLSAYVLRVIEPTGYLIASTLQQRYGEPDPQRAIRDSAGPGGIEPVLVGVLPRATLVEVLGPLAPATRPLAVALEQAPRGGPLQVVVAAFGGAEILPLGVAAPG
jgi:hypothetical protein